MTGVKPILAWLLVGGVAVVGAGAAAVGAVQSPKYAPLYDCTTVNHVRHCTGAVPNTLSAANFSEVLVETTAQGQQTDNLVFQAPDRLGGYVQSGNRRTYVYVIGSNQYQSLTVPPGTSTAHLTFYRQASQGAAALDPAHGYLPYAYQDKQPTRSGNTYSFTLTQRGQTGNFVYTVNGQYISEFTLGVSNASVRLVISGVGTSPKVALPAGARVVAAPAGGVG